jgi:hypothetical protein
VTPVPAIPQSRAERRERRRRAAKIVLAVTFAVIWVPVAIVMLFAGMSDRRA